MRLVRWLILVLFLAVLAWRWPLFHLLPLQAARQQQMAALFDPGQFAANFWKDRLLPSLPAAAPASSLIQAIQTNPAAARKKFGRSVGLGADYFYFLSGTGKVVSATADQVSIACLPPYTNADLAIAIGPVFGDALRDGSGLLSINDYPNSQDFNAISAALDHLSETQVLPEVKSQARVGLTVRLAGCAEVDDESTDLRPLNLVPILFEAAPTP